MAFLLSGSPEKAKPVNPYDFDLASDDEEDDDDQGIFFAGGKSSKTANLAAASLPPPTAAAYVRKRPGPASIARSSSSGSSSSSVSSTSSSSVAEVLAEEEDDEEEDGDASTQQSRPGSHDSFIKTDTQEHQVPNRNEISPRFLTIDDLDAVLVAEEEHERLQEEGNDAEAEAAEAVAIIRTPEPSASSPSLLPAAPPSSLALPLTSLIIETKDQGTQCTGNDAGVQAGLGELNAPILASSAFLTSPSSIRNLKQACRREIWLAYLALLEEQQARFVRTREEMMALLQQARRTKEKWSTGQDEEDAVVAAVKRQIAQI